MTGLIGLYRYCPWIAHTNLLSEYLRATVQEEREVMYTPKFGYEAFHLWVERFCCCICWAVDKIVEHFVLFWFEGFHGRCHLWQSACWDLLVPGIQFLVGTQSWSSALSRLSSLDVPCGIWLWPFCGLSFSCWILSSPCSVRQWLFACMRQLIPLTITAQMLFAVFLKSRSVDLKVSLQRADRYRVCVRIFFLRYQRTP